MQNLSFSYPKLPSDPKYLDKHGIPDPFHDLENNLESESFHNWLDSQNFLTESYISSPTRDKIKSLLESLYNYEKFSSCEKHGCWHIQLQIMEAIGTQYNFL